MNSNIVRAVKYAKRVSKESDYRKYHMGAVIFYKNKILSSGCNSYKGNPLQSVFNKYRATPDCSEYLLCGSHAEINAIRELYKNNKDIDFSKLSILVYRESADGRYAMAKPCKSCEAALKKFGIKNIYYTKEGCIVHEEYLDNEV